MIKGKILRMSDRRKDRGGQSSGGELDELIPRQKGPRDLEADDEEEEEEEEDGIQYEKTKQSVLPEISEHQRKANDEEKDKQGSFHGNRKKIRSKVEQILLSPLRQFNKRRAGEKKAATDRRYNNPPPPFPYDGEDFGGMPSCYLFPLKTSTAAPSKNAETSSYYHFTKSLIEKNDFYSMDCNVHREFPCSHPK